MRCWKSSHLYIFRFTSGTGSHFLSFVSLLNILITQFSLQVKSRGSHVQLARVEHCMLQLNKLSRLLRPRTHVRTRVRILRATGNVIAEELLRPTLIATAFARGADGAFSITI